MGEGMADGIGIGIFARASKPKVSLFRLANFLGVEESELGVLARIWARTGACRISRSVVKATRLRAAEDLEDVRPLKRV